MQNRMALFLTVILVLLGLGGAGALAQSDASLVRFVHVIPGAAAIDVYVDGQLTISELGLGAASDYINVAEGRHQIRVTGAGLSTTLWEQDVTTAGTPLTLVAASTEPLNFLVYPDDLSPLAAGNIRLTAVNAVAAGQALDLLLADGRAAFGNLQYNQPFGSFDLPAFVYEFTITPSGAGLENALAEIDPLALSSGESYMVVVYGSDEAPSTLLLSQPTATGDSDGLVRLAHAAADAPTVDVYLGDTLLAPALDFGDVTGHVAIPGGTYDLSLRQVGGDEIIASTELTVEAGSAATALALGSADDVFVQDFSDDVASVAADTSVLNLINAIPGDNSISVTLQNGTSLATDLAFGSAGGPVSIAPSIQTVTLELTQGNLSETFDFPAEALYGGVYYDVIATHSVAGGPELHFQASSLAQGIASAPGAAEIVVAAAPVAEAAVQVVAADTDQATVSSQVEVAQAQTPEPTVEPQVIVVTATPAPQVVPAQQVQPAPEASGPTGRIVLDPGANLHLRQFPRADALSLGLAPSGAILTILGREGAPLLPDDAPTPEPGTEFIDPVTLLDPEDDDADLVPEETWLNVDFITPDGGVINAWVNSAFLEVRDEDNRLQRLAELDTVPNNQPGEARDTEVTPPPIPEDRVTATVIGLDPGVNLHMRRTLGTDGESIALLPGGTVLEFLGIDENREWVFTRYTSPEGGIVTGWVFAEYTEYAYNGRDIDLEEMQVRELLTITPPETRGELRSGAAAPPAPTVDPLRDAFVAEVTIDPGANLHLRRGPDPNAESLALVPSGALLIVSVRTEDGEWLRAAFEGNDGWVASDFVRLTFNNRSAELTDVPLSQ